MPKAKKGSAHVMDRQSVRDLLRDNAESRTLEQALEDGAELGVSIHPQCHKDRPFNLDWNRGYLVGWCFTCGKVGAAFAVEHKPLPIAPPCHILGGVIPIAVHDQLRLLCSVCEETFASFALVDDSHVCCMKGKT